MSEIRILIIEDNRDAAQMYATLLEVALSRGEPIGPTDPILLPITCKVDVAFNVPSGRRLIHASSFDLVVVDLKLPGGDDQEMGGLEIASTMQQVDPLCPVLVITAYGTTDRVRQSFLLGVFDVIEKTAEFGTALTTAARKAIAQRRNRLIQVGNPFVAVPGREPAVLGGREKAFDFFQERLSRAVQARVQEHFLVLGRWGMGKSTLLQQFKKVAQAQGLLATIVTLEPTGSDSGLQEVTQALIQGILRDVTIPRLWLKNLSGYLESVGIKVLGGGFEIKLAPTQTRPSPQTLISDTLFHLWNDVKDRTHLFVILLDDIEHQAAAANGILILRAVLESDRMREANFLVGLASSPKHWVNLAKTQEHRRLPSRFRLHIDLDALTDGAVATTIAETLKQTGVTFEPDVIEAVCRTVQGHPAKLQLLCYNLFKNQRDGRVTLEGWDNALSDTLDQLGIAMYEAWLDEIGTSKVMTLRYLLAAPGPVTADELLSRTDFELAQPNRKELLILWFEELCDQRIMRREGGAYAMNDVLLSKYVERDA